MKKFLLAVLLLLSVSTTASGQGPSPVVVNSASGISDDLAPGTLISIKGSNLASGTASAPAGSTNSILNGVTVKIAGVPVGLLYVSPTQVNGLIDPSTPVGSTMLSLSSPTVNVAAVPVNIRPSIAPGLFALSGAGSGDGNILNGTTYVWGPFSVTTNGSQTSLALFLTGLDLSTTPTATIGGMAAPVQFSAPATCCPGMQEVNVTVPAALDGAGRVDVFVTSGGANSNVVEVLLLPSGGPFPPPGENQARSREIGAIAFVAASGQTLVLDEADDVIRVVDVKQRAVVRTIALPSGSQPFALTVNDSGSVAVVAERARARVAFVRLADGVVVSEIPVDPGPAAVAISGDTVAVASEYADTVSVISLAARQVLAVVPVGRAPRSIAIDDSSFLAYVVNQDAGTVSVVDLSRRVVVNTIALGANARPQNARLVPSAGVLAVTEPDAGTIDFINLSTGAVSRSQANATDLAFQQGNAYFASQTGAVANIAPVQTAPAGVSLGTSSPITLDAGLRSVAVDAADHLMLVSSESSGTLALIDLSTNREVGTINAVRGEKETVAHDDRSDRLTAGNLPVITALAPRQAAAGSTVQLVVNGANLAGTFGLQFVAADGSADPAFTITNAAVETTGQQITLTLQIAPGAASGDHVLQVLTPNGESSIVAGTNVLSIL